MLALTTGNPVYLISTKGSRLVWTASRGCLLLRGTWSYLHICRGSVLPHTRFCLLDMVTVDTLLTSLFCIRNAIHSYCADWKVRITESTHQHLCQLFCLWFSDGHCGLQELHGATFDCQLLVLMTGNSVYLISTCVTRQLWQVSWGRLFLHGTSSYLCFCRDSVLPYTWPCGGYIGINVTFDTLLISPIDS
jgi:hypothetical protein